MSTGGRPRLPVGAHGEISTRQMPDGRWEASTRVRDADGRVRKVRRYRPTEGAAKRALREHLTDRHTPNSGPLTGDTTIADAVEMWLDDARKRGRLREQTLRVYGSAWRALAPPIEGLTLRECTTRHIAEAVDALAEVAPGQVKNAVAMLKSTLSYAVREGATQLNPARELEPPASRPRGEVRALTQDEEVLLLRLVRDHRTERDPRQPVVRGPRPTLLLPDVTLLLLGTGLRIGEALALRWSDIDLDRDPPTLKVSGTMVEGHGAPMYRQPMGKTESAHRTLALPDAVAEMLRRRQAEARAGVRPIFATKTGRHVSPADVRRLWRAALERTDLEWATPRHLRKTVATRIETTLGIRAAMEQLGHARPAVTEDHYTAKSGVRDNRVALDPGPKPETPESMR